METLIFKTIIKKLEVLGDVVLDYDVEINHLKENDRVYHWEATGTNFSLAGLEIRLYRHKMAYILEYYATSGLFVVVSWVKLY
jgi:hypothetical protein